MLFFGGVLNVMAYRNCWYYCFIYTIFILISQTSYSAEKWAYQLERTGSNFDVVGKKTIDGVVEDRTYKAKFDSNTKLKILGEVAFNKVTESNGYTSTNITTLTALLIQAGYTIDKSKKEIYRDILDEDYGCRISTTDGKSIYQFGIVMGGGITNNYDCLEQWRDEFIKTKKSINGVILEYVSHTPIDLEKALRSGTLITVKFNRIIGSTKSEDYYNPKISTKLKQSLSKEYITKDNITEYIYGTHKDFSVSKYNLPKNQITNLNEMFSVLNDFEYQYSPTVQYVLSLLKGANPSSNNTTSNGGSTSNPDGTQKSWFDLPDFCDWATPVCDLFTWIKEPFEDSQDSKINIDDRDDFKVEEGSIFWGKGCPPIQIIPISIFGSSMNLEFSYSPLCQFLQMIRPFVIGAAYIMACYILMGLSRGNSE